MQHAMFVWPVATLGPLTICARRYICAWLAVRAGLDGLPSSTACWEILVGVELMLWALLMS